MIQTMREKIVLTVLLLMTVLTGASGQETSNARQARRIFDNAYQQVFGEQGATFHYDVNITGLYKTSGTIWFKGKKRKFEDAKVRSWNNGTIIYTVRRKKRNVVEIHNAKKNKSDKYSRRFKFDPENFDYSIANHEEGLMLTLDGKKGTKGIKEAHVLVDRKTYHPIRVRIKIAFIWTTIKLSEFQSGGITDEMLAFPVEQFKDYKYIDKR